MPVIIIRQEVEGGTRGWGEGETRGRRGGGGAIIKIMQNSKKPFPLQQFHRFQHVNALIPEIVYLSYFRLFKNNININSYVGLTMLPAIITKL